MRLWFLVQKLFNICVLAMRITGIIHLQKGECKVRSGWELYGTIALHEEIAAHITIDGTSVMCGFSGWACVCMCIGCLQLNCFCITFFLTLNARTTSNNRLVRLYYSKLPWICNLAYPLPAICTIYTNTEVLNGMEYTNSISGLHIIASAWGTTHYVMYVRVYSYCVECIVAHR